MSQSDSDSDSDTASTLSVQSNGVGVVVGLPVFDVSEGLLRFGQLAYAEGILEPSVVPVFLGVVHGHEIRIGQDVSLPLVYPRWLPVERLNITLPKQMTVPSDGWRMLVGSPLEVILSLPLPTDAVLNYDVAELKLTTAQARALLSSSEPVGGGVRLPGNVGL
jgi:hypothetical protein